MSNEKHVIDLLPAYALSILDEMEAIDIEHHLEKCASCRARLLEFRQVAGQLALSVAEDSPPKALKTRLLKEVRQGLETNKNEAPLSLRQRLGNFLQGPAPAWGLAGLIVVVVLLASGVLLWQQLNRARLPEGLPVVELVSTENAPQAAGTLVMSRDSRKGTLVVDGLPALGDEQEYQLWLIKSGERTSGGVFSVSSDGYGYVRVNAPQPLLDFDGFGVTIEPAGGSPAPTGVKVLGTPP